MPGEGWAEFSFKTLKKMCSKYLFFLLSGFSILQPFLLGNYQQLGIKHEFHFIFKTAAACPTFEVSGFPGALLLRESDVLRAISDYNTGNLKTKSNCTYAHI